MTDDISAQIEKIRLAAIERARKDGTEYDIPDCIITDLGESLFAALTELAALKQLADHDPAVLPEAVREIGSQDRRIKELETENAALKLAARWIPTGERLPNENVGVLVWSDDGEIRVGTLLKSHWWTHDGVDMARPLIAFPYWRPLPAGPWESEGKS